MPTLDGRGAAPAVMCAIRHDGEVTDTTAPTDGPSRPTEEERAAERAAAESAAKAASDRSARSGRRPRDMALSLAVLLVPILVGFGLWQYLTSDRQVNTVDTAPVFTQARNSGAFPVAVPTGLPKGWKATSAAAQGTGATPSLRIGYITPSGGFAQLVEQGRRPGAARPAPPSGMTPAGARVIAGHDWVRFTGGKNQTTLERVEDKRVIQLVGQTDEKELATLGASLRG